MTQPRDIETYLAALRRALRIAPGGLIADALADAEEHLRGAMESGRSEAEVIAAYGSPEEVAAEYLRQELPPASPFDRTDTPAPVEVPPARPFKPGFLGVLSDPLAYGALLYMLLALATGIFLFVWAVVGTALSLGLSILIIGVPFFLAFVGSVRVLSHLEGRIVEVLLGTRMPRRLPAAQSQQKLMDKIRQVLRDGRTWSSILYMLVRLPLSIIYFVLSLLTLVLPAVMMGVGGWQALNFWRIHTITLSEGGMVEELHYRGSGYSFHEDAYGEMHFHGPDWMLGLVQTPLPGIVFLLVGALLFLLMLHLVRATGRGHGRLAETLLVRV